MVGFITRAKPTAACSCASIGTVATRAVTHKALETSLPASAITRLAFRSNFTLRVVVHVAEGVCGISDTDGCDDGSGGDDDAFSHDDVGFVFGYFFRFTRMRAGASPFAASPIGPL